MKKKFTILITAAFMLLTMMARPVTVWGQTRDTKTDIMFAKGFGGYTTNSFSAAGTDRSAVANSTNATGVTYAMQVFNGSTGAVRGNQSGASNFSCRNTTSYEGYYISSVTLRVSGGTLDGSTNGRSVVYFGSSAYANPNTTAPSGTATSPSPNSSGQTTLTWTNTDENVSYFILYNLKTSGTALSANAQTPLTVVWTQKTQSSVAAPVLSLGTGTYGGTQSVEITCATTGADIYYTLDGIVPSASSTPYTGAVSITESKTLKAIAIKDNESSAVVTATYTILTPLTTMQDIFDAATSTSTQVAITFDNFVVTGKNSGTPSTKAYLTDGTKGCIIYESNHGFTAGDVLSGTAICNLVLFGNAAELTGLTKNTSGLSVTEGGVVEPILATYNSLSAVNTGSLVTINGLKYNGTSTLRDSDNNPIVLSNTIYSASLTDGKTYNITGVFEVNYSNKRINPRSAADIVEYSGPSLTATPNALEFSYQQGASAEVQTLSIGGENLSGNITVTLNGEYFAISADGNDWSQPALTLNEPGTIQVRFNSGLSINNYEGTITVSSEGASSVIVNLTGTVTAQPYNVTYYANYEGADPDHYTDVHYAGDNVTLRAANTFSYTGHEFTKWNTAADGSGTPYEAGATITGINANYELYAQWEEVSEVTDELTKTLINISGNSYQTWTNIKDKSNACYTGQSYGSATDIQIRATSPSGIITTVSGGKVTKVAVVWASTTDRTLQVYGKNSAYENLTDLYSDDSETKGTLLGSISYSSNQTELVISEDYEFIGMRSANNSMNLSKISITWSTEEPSVAAPTFSPEGGQYIGTQNVQISCATPGASIRYTLDGSDPTSTSTLYENAISVATTTTIKAKAFLGEESSSIASATYTILQPLTTMDAIFEAATSAGSTATDVYITFSNWVVTGVSTNSKRAFVTDGTKGFVIYDNNSALTFEKGNKLNGTVLCKVQLSNGAAQITNLNANNFEEITTGEIIENTTTIADLEPINTGSVVNLGVLTYNGTTSKFEDSNENTITPYNGLYNYSAFTDGQTYTVKGVYVYYNYNEIAPRDENDIVEYNGPSIEATPSPFTAPSYVVGTAEPEYETLIVNGSNLTANISLSLGDNSNFEMSTDLDTWSSSLTLTQTDGSVTNAEVAIRLKAGLTKGDYNGTVTLSSTGAQNVVVNLSGSVTGQTYAINIDNEITGGTIEADLTTAEEGATVTLTATPDAAYNFGSWTVEDEDENPITVSDNQFVMPASDVMVTATFTPKDTYAITCAVTPEGAALMEASPASAYEGQTVTLTYTAEDGFTLSSIVITKTSGGSATDITPTASGDDYTFTMPGYAVTATATFISDTYYGSFVKFTGSAMEEGDYILVYNGKAMNNDNTTTSKKLGASDVNISNSIIADPSRSIVWHIASIGTDGQWTIHNAYVNKYVNASGSSSTDITLVDNASWSNGAKWNVSIDESTYDFSNLSNTRALRYYSSSNAFGHYSTSNGGPFTLYKYTVLTKRTITFNGNGGTTPTGETYTQTVYDGIATNLTANQFTKENSAFIGWSTTQNGEVEYADGASITVSSDITLYAQWSTAYTAMVDDAIVGGSVLINGDEIVEAAEGAVLNLTYTSNPGYAFSAWNVYKADNPTEAVEVENNQFNMPEYDVIVSAKFDEVTTYSLVTNVNQIVSGKHYIIATGSINNKYYAIGGQNSSGYRNPVEVTVDNNYIAHTDGLYEFVLNGDNESGWTIYDKVTPGYFVSGNKSLTTNANNGTAFNISINDENDPKATISKNSYSIQYNSSSPRFACYSSSQKDVYLYIKLNDNDLEYYGTEINYAQDEIPAGETITVGTGSVMTVPNGFTNDNPTVLIIEDGGQLIISNDLVAATVKKNIVGHNPSAKDGVTGYCLISSPINDMTPASAHMIAATAEDYDLYRFDQTKKLEWINYKSSLDNGGQFNLMSGQGYLYANKENETLEFAGTIYNGNGIVYLTLDNTSAFAGWNLVGNPFTQDAYINRSYYVMNSTGSEILAETVSKDNAIKPMQGIFVIANENNEQMTFSKEPQSSSNNNGGLTLNVNQTVNTRGESSNNLVDRAIVRFGVNDMLPKFQLNDNSSKVYFTEGNKDYAVVSAEAQGEMPVYFKAAENGTYTIDFSMDNVEFSYLHLIDNKTGNDVDLRQTPSYTFEASTIDYASRFRLVFRAIGNDNDSENNDFGFFDANGNFLILGIEGTATLQVMDVMGRVISNETFSGDYSKAINASAGVYMLRLIQGSNVRTQKVVVK